jgi:parvulin-like peptidyl-prolyl isomerase
MNDAREAILVQAYLQTVAVVDPAFPSEAELAAAYEANKTKMMVPKQYNLSQIAIILTPDASREAVDEARRKIADLRTQALRPKADFAELARKNSQERATAEKGGAIGWVREDQLVPGVKEVVPAMADNAISEPIRTASGWHLIKLAGIKPSAPAPLAEVKDQLTTALRQGRQQQLARAYVEDMLKRDPIQLNEIDLARAIQR